MALAAEKPQRSAKESQAERIDLSDKIPDVMQASANVVKPSRDAKKRAMPMVMAAKGKSSDSKRPKLIDSTQ